eukprot:scaffold11929_cov107-Isochrysis_galbana.AAC.14
MNPMLFRGHKFDVRVWAVVLSIDPLRVHMLGTGIPKVTRLGRPRRHPTRGRYRGWGDLRGGGGVGGGCSGVGGAGRRGLVGG